jgi:hypothetical protein
MDASAIYRKTDKGTDELKSRGKNLPQRLRTMLILIDGTRTVAELQPAAAKMGGEGDFITVLERQGLVEPVPAAGGDSAGPRQAAGGADDEFARFRVLHKFMTESVADALGVRAFFFTLKLEKCSTRADLALLVEDYCKAIAKGSGEDAAAALTERVRELLR